MFSIKRYLKIGGLIAGIMICSSVCFAQNSYYYYGGGVQISLSLSLDKITVRFLPTMTPEDIRNFILSDRALDPNKEPEPTLDKFLVLYVSPWNDVEALIQRLRSRQEVKMANPVYLTSDYMEVIVTDRFVVQFYPWVSRSTIDSLDAQHGAVIVDSLSLEVPNLFLLKLTGDIDKDVLVTANQYYEEPTTDYSHPDFLAEIIPDIEPDSYYYYSAGVKNPLLLSGEKVAVRFLPTLTPDDIDNFILSESALDPNIEPEPTLDDFLVLYVLPGNDVEALIQRLRSSEEVEMANPVYLTPDSMECIVTDVFVAKFYPSISRSSIDGLNAQHGVVIADSMPDIPNLFLLKLTGAIDKNALVTANQYYENVTTEYSHADFVNEIILSSYIPNDSFFQSQWNYENTGQIGGKIDADVDAPLAWEICKGDSNLKVAVIDQGVESHEDIGTLAQGYDVVGDSANNPKEDWDPTPGDACAHGEACAGLIAAVQNNSKGISGLAPLCQIVPIKIFDNSRCLGTAQTWRVAKAFDMAGALGAKVVSNSWGYNSCTYRPDDIVQAINRFIRPKPSNLEGGVVVFSSGNGSASCVFFPANLDSVIAVGASDSLDKVWAYSNGGTALDLVSPSGITNLQGDIWTMDLMGTRGYNPTYPGPTNVNYTARFGGTSGACPQVAATAALIKAQWWRLYQALPCSSYQVKEIIEKSAEDSCYLFQGGGSDTTECFSLRYGYGRLNAFRALLAISRGDANNDKSMTITDVTYLINYLFYGGPPPLPTMEMGDANCDGKTSVSDAVYLINYLLKGGPKPLICYKYPNNY